MTIGRSTEGNGAGIFGRQLILEDNLAVNTNSQVIGRPSSGKTLSVLAPYLEQGSYQPYKAGGVYVCGQGNLAASSGAYGNTSIFPVTGRSAIYKNYAGGFIALSGDVQGSFGGTYTTYFREDRNDFTAAFSDFTGSLADASMALSSLTENLDDSSSGGVYDSAFSDDMWVTPWGLSVNQDHPSMLKAISHFIPVENPTTITDILGSVRLISTQYPMFVRITYSVETGRGRHVHVLLHGLGIHGDLRRGSGTRDFPVPGKTNVQHSLQRGNCYFRRQSIIYLGKLRCTETRFLL